MNLEELSKMAIEKLRNETPRCRMSNCVHIGEYRPCYLQTSISCPIYKAIYERLTEEQREILIHPDQFYFS